MASPLLAGIPISSRFAEKLGMAQEKQSQQQMTHTRSSTQEDKSWDQTLYEKSDIYRSIKDAYTAPIRAWRGEIDPYSDEGVMEAINLAGVGMGGSIPGGSTSPGALNLIRGQKVFRFTNTGGEQVIPGLGKVLKDITPDLKGISRRFANPEEEFGTHVGTDRSAAEHISREKRGFVDENGILTLASQVEKPYWVEDTGGTWNPDQVVHALTNRVGPNLDNMLLKDKGRLSKQAIEQLYKIQRDYKNYKEAWDKEDGILSPITKPGMKQADYVAALDTKYNKQIQEILKKEGFDHISYINTREGNPVESAILFDRKDVDLAMDLNPIGGALNAIRQPLRENFLRRIEREVPELYRETNGSRFLNFFGGNYPFGAPRWNFAETPDMALGQGNNKGLRFKIKTEGLEGKVNRDKPGLEQAYLSGMGEFIVVAQPSDLLKNLKEVVVSPEAFTGLSRGEKKRLENILIQLEDKGISVKRVTTEDFYTLPKEGLNEISSPIQDLETSIQEQVKQLDNTGWNRLPGAAGKRDSDVQPTFLQKMYKEHPDLVKSKPSELEKLEIKLRRIYKLPEEEIEDIMLPLWSTYLRNQKSDDPAEEHTQKTKMKRWT